VLQVIVHAICPWLRRRRRLRSSTYRSFRYASSLILASLAAMANCSCTLTCNALYPQDSLYLVGTFDRVESKERRFRSIAGSMPMKIDRLE
jgi:hypothetical protein